MPGGLRLQGAGEPDRDLLERPILQQAGEQQVARLEERDVVGIHQFALRQQPGDLQVEQRGGDDEELAGRVELLGGLQRAQVGEEFIRDLAQRDLGDVEFVLRDQGQQQVERAAVVAEVDRESGVVAALQRGWGC